MAKNNKGMICLLQPWEWEDYHANGARPDCRNHGHLSRRRACELLGQARFADRSLAHVYDSQEHCVGFIVEVAGRVRWCEKRGDKKREVTIDAACYKSINAHLNRLQAMVDAGEQPFEIIKLSSWRGMKPGIPPRAAMISETLRSHSPCGITANESELNAEGALARKRAQRPQTK